MDSCLVVGTGLIGTSVALALRRGGVTVHLTDRDPVATRRAADLGAGDPAPPGRQVDL
ncbi:MAG: prephenate dehydrogenase, partial [Actinomycetes bacterium]